MAMIHSLSVRQGTNSSLQRRYKKVVLHVGIELWQKKDMHHQLIRVRVEADSSSTPPRELAHCNLAADTIKEKRNGKREGTPER